MQKCFTHVSEGFFSFNLCAQSKDTINKTRAVNQQKLSQIFHHIHHHILNHLLCCVLPMVQWNLSVLH